MLAMDVNISRPMLSKIENGVESCDNETINKQYLNSIVKILKDNHIDKVILHCAKQLKIKERITASKTRKKEKGNFEITNENFEMINDSPPKYKKSSTYVKKKNELYIDNG